MGRVQAGSLRRFVYRLRRRKRTKYPVDFTPEEVDIIRSVKPYTMTTSTRIQTLIRAVQHVVKHDIPGDIVECGVWRGGSMMAVAKTLLALGCQSRRLYLFDTFEGMTRPGERDVSRDGHVATEYFRRWRTEPDRSNWCRASLDEVERLVRSIGYDNSMIHFVPGKVEDTIPDQAPDTIAVLRLDTDFHESTRHELEHLFPRLSTGGMLILDDYDYWQGVRQATDEYVARNHLNLFLHRIDSSARVAVKG